MANTSNRNIDRFFMEFMKISGFTDKYFKIPLKDDKHVVISPYSFIINPDTIKLQRTFDNIQQVSTQNTLLPGSKLNFDTIIDCTGIVDSKRTNLPSEIKKVENILYRYSRKKYKPNFIKIQWGNNFTFYGLVILLEITYTLFKPDGTPIRAKISIGFDECFL